jgi:hypothetical protein
VRLSVVLLVVSLLGVLLGGWLTGRVGFGLCVIADSVALGVWVLFRDDGIESAEPSVHELPTLEQALERARRAA